MKTSTILFSLLFELCASQSCYERGECLFSLYLDDSPVSGAQECRDECVEGTEGCAAFTYYAEDGGACFRFGSCEEFSPDTCGEECYSGSADCGDLPCFESGLQCQGGFIDEFSLPGAEDCNRECGIDRDCVWWNYSDDDGVCVLLTDCQQVDDTCFTCVRGHTLCGDVAPSTTSKGTTEASSTAGVTASSAASSVTSSGGSTAGSSVTSTRQETSSTAGTSRGPTSSGPTSTTTSRFGGGGSSSAASTAD